jgi:hypothetical protein
MTKRKSGEGYIGGNTVVPRNSAWFSRNTRTSGTKADPEDLWRVTPDVGPRHNAELKREIRAALHRRRELKFSRKNTQNDLRAVEKHLDRLCGGREKWVQFLRDVKAGRRRFSDLDGD